MIIRNHLKIHNLTAREGSYRQKEGRQKGKQYQPHCLSVPILLHNHFRWMNKSSLQAQTQESQSLHLLYRFSCSNHMEDTEGTQQLGEQVLPCWTLTPRWHPAAQRARRDHITLPCFSHGFLWFKQKPSWLQAPRIYIQKKDLNTKMLLPRPAYLLAARFSYNETFKAGKALCQSSRYSL